MKDIENFICDLASKLEYRPDGSLVWLYAGKRSDLVGLIAGTVSSTDGYRYIKYRQKRIVAHRVVFYMHHGYVPDEIDHINRVRDDNRIQNLREATSHTHNLGNQSIQKREKSSKYKGVCWDKNRMKWMAYIKNKGKITNIGRFSSEKDAASAYNSHATMIFGDFANLNDLQENE